MSTNERLAADFNPAFDGVPSDTSEEIHHLLEGRQCKAGEQDRVVEALYSLDPTQRLLIYAWAMYYPAQDIMSWAYDRAVACREQCSVADDLATRNAANGYLDGMIKYLELIKVSDEVPTLEYVEPDDDVGEELDNFVWTVIAGGAQEQLFAEQLAFLQHHLGRYQDYVMGRVRMIQLPNSVMDRLPSETIQTQTNRKAKQAAAAIQNILTFLGPGIRQTHTLLERMGCDPTEYGIDLALLDAAEAGKLTE